MQPQQLLVAYHDAFTRQHDPQAPITGPATFKCNLAKTRPQVAICAGFAIDARIGGTLLLVRIS